MQNVLGRRIEMVEYAEEMNEFIANIFKPAGITRTEMDNETGIINVFVNKRSDLGIAIGKGGCNIEKGRLLVRRFYGFEMGDVYMEEGSE